MVGRRPRSCCPSKRSAPRLFIARWRVGWCRCQVVSVLCGPCPVVCLLGETGSGKSTQVPQMILEEARKAKGHARVCVTQPRRVAALNLAGRVAEELGEAVGRTVGYRIGGESRPGQHIDFCTVGYVLQLFLNAPEEFGSYTHVVLDEVHERSRGARPPFTAAHRAQGAKRHVGLREQLGLRAAAQRHVPLREGELCGRGRLRRRVAGALPGDE